jgi:FKBP-type peptidyl-prolyl cis-trans isomerase
VRVENHPAGPLLGIAPNRVSLRSFEFMTTGTRGYTMFRRTAYTLLLSTFAVTACQAPDAGRNASLDTEDQKASYGIGMNMGSQLAPAEAYVDLDAFMAGLTDGMSGAESRVSQAEIQAAIQALSTRVQEEESTRMAAEAETNAAEGEAFLAENAQKDGIMVTASGLQYEVITEGEGAKPTATDQVSIHYKGTLLDGTQFDSSYDRGQPAQFSVGGVIPGFSEGLQLMSVGSHYRFFIPSDLGYGPQGTGRDIGPNAMLIFEVEMLEIVQ